MMIPPEKFLRGLCDRGIDFFAGVPDSLLANFCLCVEDYVGFDKHLIMANEGNAVGLGIGFHLSTGKIAAIYMQNSGIGNAINPLISLADKKIFSIPMLLIIGWRGEPGYLDEPQHVTQGEVTLDQLTLLGIPFTLVDSDSNVDEILDSAFDQIKKCCSPVALVFKKNTFAPYKSIQHPVEQGSMAREVALDTILDLCSPSSLVIATTGKTSRELFELREKSEKKGCDFLSVGGMGHVSSIALGVAIGKPKREVVCLDGDGSLIMHLGALPVISSVSPSKFKHILLNNGSHESVGGQPTCANNIDFKSLSMSIGYKGYGFAADIEGLKQAWKNLSEVEGPILLEVKIRNGSRSNLGRPTITPIENKILFMRSASDKD